VNNKLIFLRHAPTLKDISIPIEQWGIQPESAAVLTGLSNLPDFANIDIIYSSPKNKALVTAQVFSQKNNLEIIKVKDLAEIEKPGAEKLSTQDYENMKLKIISDPNFTDLGWETSGHALDRFTLAVNTINSENEDKNILIVSHGTILTLYFAKLQNQLSNIITRWQNLKFGNYGIIVSGVITKDIV
jgi:broad specificity phosphatase PhoE